jgi:hypothetical protein
MTIKKRVLLLITFSIILILACNLPSSQANESDPNAVFTAAAQTASVQLTQVAESRPKTQTPVATKPSLPPLMAIPTITPTEDNCDKAKFITDVTVPDGTAFSPGENYTKTWRVRNNGTCTWTSDYALVFVSGEKMGGTTPQLLMTSVAPGDTVDISIDLKAPATDGNYVGNWQIRNSSNDLFAKVYVQIKVVSGEFAVTSVKLYAPNAGVAADITVNKGGEVEYHWIFRESGQSDITTSTKKISFSQPGTKTVSQGFTCPHSGNFTAYLYVDDPNHQEFGKADFTCP